VTRLVGDLKDAGILNYDVRRTTYRLERRARVIAALCNALTGGDVEQIRIIKVLNATMRLADALNSGTDAAFLTFLSAIAVLEYDCEELERLLGEGTEAALALAVGLAQTHVEDMKALMTEQRELFARFSADMRFLDHDHRAADLLACLSGLASVAIGRISHQADLRLQGTMRLDRGELAAMVSEASVDDLAAIVADSTRCPPVFLTGVDAVSAFGHLADYLDRIRPVAQPLPLPCRPEVEEPRLPHDHAVRRAARALEDLAEGGGRLSEWVVAGEWSAAVNRSTSAVEAWARHGPSGDGSLRAVLEPRERLERIGRDEVGWMSETGLGPAASEQPA